jgi:hypothetical protein
MHETRRAPFLLPIATANQSLDNSADAAFHRQSVSEDFRIIQSVRKVSYVLPDKVVRPETLQR